MKKYSLKSIYVTTHQTNGLTHKMIPCRINQVATGIFVTTPDPSIVIFSQIKKYKLKFIFVITYMLLHFTTLKIYKLTAGIYITTPPQPIL